MKMYVCICVTVLVTFFIMYYMGMRFGAAKCAGNMADNIAVQQSAVVKASRRVNEQTFNRNVDDIRRILREKYTIAE